MQVIQALRVCFTLPRNFLFLGITVAISFLLLMLSPTSAFADDFSITTSGSVDILTSVGTSNISSSDVNVISTCHAGYNLTLSTTVNDNSLYLGGNDTVNHRFTAISNNTILKNATNTWGYSMGTFSGTPSVFTPPTVNDFFHSVPNSTSTPATLKTPSSTASETDIDDNFSVYYGANAASDMASGSYVLNANGALLYQLTADPLCAYAPVTVSLDANTTSVTFTNDLDPNDYQIVTGNGGTINLLKGASYTISAAFNTGYRLDHWAAGENGTLDSTLINPTTFTVTGASTLDVVSEEIPSHAVSVFFDSGVTSVSFSNIYYGSRSVTTSGGVVYLRSGVEYTVSASTTLGYGLDTWTTTGQGEIGNATTNPTTFTTFGSSELTASTVSVPTYTCSKKYRLQNADGTYPSAYTSDGSEQVDYNETCSYTKQIENYKTTSESKTVLSDTTISLDIPRTEYRVIINENDSFIDGTTGEGIYRWGQQVRVRAFPKAGSIFTSWSQTAGDAITFDDATDDITLFTMPASNVTIYADGEALSYSSHTVTVNMDEHVTGISFSSPECGGHQVTTSGSVISICDNVSYLVTSTYDDGYVTDTWTTTPEGTLSSTNTARTSYSITDDAVLSLTSASDRETILVQGEEFNTKIKTLAEGSSTSFDATSSKIKSLQVANTLPAGFTPSSDNTVSIPDSAFPVYVFFDNTDDAGIMYFYTESNDVHMNTDSSNMFYNNLALTDISVLSTWNAGNVTNMSGMFATQQYSVSSLADISAIASWDTSNVRNMSRMFANVPLIADISALKNWDTSNVRNMSGLFKYEYYSGSPSLTNIDALANWNTSKVTDISQMFYQSRLSNLDGALNWDTSNVTNISEIFYSADSTNIDGVSKWDTSKVTDMSGAFSLSSIANIDALANWKTSMVTDMSRTFYEALKNKTDISALANWNTSNVTDMRDTFSGFGAYNIDALSTWNTSKVTDMQGTFSNTSFYNFNALSGWDTSKVTNMSWMFINASLKNIDALVNWDTSKVTNMSNMFSDTCIKNVDGALYWDTSSVLDMSSMFYNTAHCLININGVRDWNTSNVTDMSSMFEEFRSNTQIAQMYSGHTINIDGAANWDTSKVTDMSLMFKHVPISNASALNNWDINKVKATAGSSVSSTNKFYQMFCRTIEDSAYYIECNATSVHPEFTKRPGVWNTQGTFIPDYDTPTTSSP